MAEDILTMDDGSQWHQVTTSQTIACASCGNEVDTEEEAQSYANGGTCPSCNNSWTEKRSVTIGVAAPTPMAGQT